MTQIQWLVETNRNKVAALKLLMADLNKRIEKLEWEKQCLLMNILYFPSEQKN